MKTTRTQNLLAAALACALAPSYRQTHGRVHMRELHGASPPRARRAWRDVAREPLNNSYAGATVVFRDEMREARRSEW